MAPPSRTRAAHPRRRTTPTTRPVEDAPAPSPAEHATAARHPEGSPHA
ncbi:hypothetical protein [Nocardiopsis exhalans]|nr:hypothetical protein [Nocardiopsis exhalans]